MLQNLQYFWNMKTQITIVFSAFHFVFYFISSAFGSGHTLWKKNIDNMKCDKNKWGFRFPKKWQIWKHFCLRKVGFGYWFSGLGRVLVILVGFFGFWNTKFLTPQQFLLHFYALIFFKLHKDWNIFEKKIIPKSKKFKCNFWGKNWGFFGISGVKYGEFRRKFWN